MAELEREIENAVQLGVRAGRVEAVARTLAESESARAAVESLLGRGGVEVDLGDLRARVERNVDDLRAAVDRAPDEANATLERLLGPRRMLVHADPERGFRLEAGFSLG